jgi:chemotaxis family two-component system sensor kinase Cph1
MTPQFRLPPGELQRLAECVLEPISFPGAVQPHGALLVVEASSLVITHASENTAAIIGAQPVALFGRPLGDLLDSETLALLEQALDPSSNAGNPVPTSLGGQPFDLIVHRVDDWLTVEFEPFEPTPSEMIQGTRGALRRLTSALTVEELWARAAAEVRTITGFDRVMVYHFHPDQHGEVVAESAVEGIDPFLGLHFPASDIPAQARELYVTKHSRQITNSAAQPAGLLADANRPLPESIDLGRTELRAVSPHHLQFMRNMGQVSTFSLSLVLNGELVGMITCAHGSELRLPYNIRDGLELLANQVALQIGAMREIERLGQRNEAQEIRAALVTQLSQSDDLVDALLHQHITLLDLVPADGAAVSIGGRIDSIGQVPTVSRLAGLDALLARLGIETRLVSESLASDYPEIAELLPSVAGLLVKRLGAAGDYIAWFRGELMHTVEWLGDMSPANRSTPLSPRNSFSAWSEDVGGTSEPWHGLEREARELARDLQAIMLQRIQSQLAELALHDPLTGLPNRRLLMDRLEQELAHTRRAEQLAVVFIDIDRFKEINDSFGHPAGDQALQHVATALTSAARGADTVARIGGDEFVVLCDNVSGDDAVRLADRILAAVAAEPVGSPGWRITASAGVALAGPGEDASQVLSAADTAMYRAKASGRGRVSL